jgi:hypothetical protein
MTARLRRATMLKFGGLCDSEARAEQWPAPSRSMMLIASTPEDPASCEKSALRLATGSLGVIHVPQWHTGFVCRHSMQHARGLQCLGGLSAGSAWDPCARSWARAAGGRPMLARRRNPGYGGSDRELLPVTGAWPLPSRPLHFRHIPNGTWLLRSKVQMRLYHERGGADRAGGALR